MALAESSPAGLWCEAGGFHVDPWAPAARAVITHAHADHARPGSDAYLCAAPALPVLRRRLGPEAQIQAVPYGERVAMGDVTLSLHPAGHVLGSAQVRLEREGEVWVISGDYKRASDPTCAPFEPLRCDVFATEATFGLPIFRWDPPEVVLGEIADWWARNREAGLASVLFCYALGKAQRILAGLADVADRPILLHGAVDALTALYREAGVVLPETAHLADNMRGRALAGALVLAPPSAQGTPWMRRFSEAETALASGWMRVRGARRRRAVDRGFVLSDHADWPALLRTIDETGAARVLVTHGYTEELARHLREQGRDAAALTTAYEGEADV